MPHMIISIVAAALLISFAAQAIAGDVVDDARAAIVKNDPKAAIALLEEALPDVAKDRLPAFLETLRDAYTSAIANAESEGKGSEASHYREGLDLLARTLPKKSEHSPKNEPPPAKTPESPRSAPEIVIPSPVEKPAEPPTAPTATIANQLVNADRAWKEKRYLDAGTAYANLEREKKLPPNRRDQWGYCRLVAVLEKINAQPQTPGEWSGIHAEIDHIRILSPKNWYSEYLRNVVVERSGGVKSKRPNELVVRGAGPDEPPSVERKPRPPSTTKPIAQAKPKPLLDAKPTNPLLPAIPPTAKPEASYDGRPGPAVGRWKTWITTNFRILHDDEGLAKDVAARAETSRIVISRRWTGADPKMSWSPRCDIYLYPTAEIFAQETQQPPDSPGFSTAGLGGGRVTARLIKIRADFPKMLEAVLPHELTHIVLADLFTTQQIPRWADEGMAVLSEPESEQALRANDLAAPLSKDVLFRLETLMVSDYPGGEHWALYYAQSVSLTRYLVSLGTPPQFAGFVKKTQTAGIDVALRETYGVEGISDLEQRWKAHAKQATAGVMAAKPDASADAVIR